MNNIINIEENKTNNYLQSFLNTCLNNNYISIEEDQTIIFKFLELLKFKIEKYTGCLTSSVTIKTFKNINDSNLWIIGLYLKQYKKDKIIDILLKEDINNIYNKSEEYLKDKINKTKMFYNTIFKNNLIKTNNYFYNTTLKEGIKAFFKIYNFSYDDCNINITADYEPLNRPNLYGIEFISKYLEYINYENIFCKKFDNDRIEKLLNQMFDDYENTPLNIAEIILIVIIPLEYLNKDIFELNVLDIALDILYNNKNLKQDLLNAYDKIKLKLNFNDKISDYFDKTITEIVNKILYSTKNKMLETLYKKKNKEIIYYTHKKMNNKDYINLVNLLKDEENKVNLIIKKTTSLIDIIDLLNDVYLSNDELTQIFSKLQIIELMVIKKYYNKYINKILDAYISKKNNREKKIINNYQFVVIKEIN